LTGPLEIPRREAKTAAEIIESLEPEEMQEEHRDSGRRRPTLAKTRALAARRGMAKIIVIATVAESSRGK
jgi:hypothetical protein